MPCSAAAGSNGEWEGEDQCKSGEHMWTLETTTGKELAEDWHEVLDEAARCSRAGHGLAVEFTIAILYR